MGEKLGGAASNPMTMIMGGGGAAGGPAGLAAPTPFVPHQTGPGIQQGFSGGQKPGPYGIVPPSEARGMAREQSGGGGKGGKGIPGLGGGGLPGMGGGLPGMGGGAPGNGMPGTPGGDFTPGSGGMGDPMRVAMDWIGGERDPISSFMGSGKGSGLSDGRGGSKK